MIAALVGVLARGGAMAARGGAMAARGGAAASRSGAITRGSMLSGQFSGGSSSHNRTAPSQPQQTGFNPNPTGAQFYGNG